MTFSIVARSADGESWGVAVASKFLAVGAVVPAAVAQVGAIATQANANVAYKGLALAHLDDGATAPVALQRLLEEDEGRDERQVGIVDLDGGVGLAHRPGLHRLGRRPDRRRLRDPGQLPGRRRRSSRRWRPPGWPARTLPFARRLLDALAAGDEAGGDKRGRQSAALLVVREEAGYAGGDDIAVDLRVDDHAAPVGELARLLDLNDLYLTASTEDEKVPVTDELRAELEEFARTEGHPDFATWVGSENYEMRVADDLSWIDQQILDVVQRGGG